MGGGCPQKAFGNELIVVEPCVMVTNRILTGRNKWVMEDLETEN